MMNERLGIVQLNLELPHRADDKLLDGIKGQTPDLCNAGKVVQRPISVVPGANGEIKTYVPLTVVQDNVGGSAVAWGGRMLYEIEGVTEELAREAFKLASAKLPFKTTFAKRTVM